MPISIRIIRSPDGESISEWNKLLPEEGGSIGRAFGASIQLSDAIREVSASHAIIKKTSRGYQIIDDSTNGLFINGSDKPLGLNNQTTLSDGDILDIGRYRLLVSCFVPEQAQTQDLSTLSEDSSLGGDPFNIFEVESSFSSNLTHAEPEPEPEPEPELDFSFSDCNIIGDNPFNIEKIEEIQEHKEVNLSFVALDDDPFSGSGLQSNLFLESKEGKASIQENANDKYGLIAYQKSEERMQQHLDRALEMALTRFLSDISPHAMEDMFDELSTPSFFNGEPKYWNMYKRYFIRQVENKDWQIKFHAYFHDAIRLERNLEGDNK
ncbi:FHA domain-containing protein [Aliivibrio logei]|jgi:predicted component of type VI protein secretion system|uniref:FHA domain-containing protein n=1 Tax=Aliivibrio logei TaxID=688 RepID=UPI0035C87FCB